MTKPKPRRRRHKTPAPVPVLPRTHFQQLGDAICALLKDAANLLKGTPE